MILANNLGRDLIREDRMESVEENLVVWLDSSSLSDSVSITGRKTSNGIGLTVGIVGRGMVDSDDDIVLEMDILSCANLSAKNAVNELVT